MLVAFFAFLEKSSKRLLRRINGEGIGHIKAILDGCRVNSLVIAESLDKIHGLPEKLITFQEVVDLLM